MNKYLYILRGPKNDPENQAQSLEEIRTWLKGIKENHKDILYQKVSEHRMLLGPSGAIDTGLLDQIEGGSILHLFTLLLPEWEKAAEIAASFPFPSEFYSLELLSLN